MSTVNPVNDLAHQVQHVVPVQPWGHYGDSPVPIQIWYDDTRSDGKPWTIKFVRALNKSGHARLWARGSGRTIDEALQDALSRT